MFIGLQDVLSRSNTNEMQIGEVRKFKIDKSKKKSCGLPGEGVIEIEIKKEKGILTEFSYEMVGNEKEAFLKCDPGYLTKLNTKGKAENCGIGRIFTELCMNEKDIHITTDQDSNENSAIEKIENYILNHEEILTNKDKIKNLRQLKKWSLSNCSKLIYLWMTADPRTGAHVYFNSAISSGFTELFMISHNGELSFYPDDGPCAVKNLQERYSDDGYMIEGDKKNDVGDWNWFFCQPKDPKNQPKCTIL